jgi:uncharacterized membrane protein
MEFFLFSLGVQATFPGVVSKALPKVLAYPTVGVSTNLGTSSYVSVEMGSLTMKTGDYSIRLLTSTFYVGTLMRNYDLAVGYTVSGVGINTLAIEDQGYVALTLRGGYVKRFGKFGVSGGILLPVYTMVTSGKLSIIPVPLTYLSLSYGW